MINAKFDIEEDTMSMQMAGHAGYANIGNDIVCSAASIIVYTLHEEIKRRKIDYKSTIQVGYFEIYAHPGKDEKHDVELMFRFAQTALNLLQASYPDNVSVTN